MADVGRIPRRKKGARFHPKEAPFPIPIQSISGKQSSNDRWYYYTGHFRDNCVVIEDSGDLTFLYKMVSYREFPCLSWTSSSGVATLLSLILLVYRFKSSAFSLDQNYGLNFFFF